MATALSGTQEYMASEVLYELAEDPRFDVVIVDTPPSRNALDFLDAPGVLTRFLDHVAKHEKVWICTSAEIAAHWRKEHPAP